MAIFQPMRNLPMPPGWRAGDVLVVFGELFARGYANGLVDEAKRHGLKVIYSTVGRRDDTDRLRPLTAAELAEKDQPLINIPLEAGFDLEPSAAGGPSPVDQLQGLKLSDWETAKVDWAKIEQSRQSGMAGFRNRVKNYVTELKAHIPKGANVLFVHTMAGGVPRAKIIMPAMNRVFKGHGERYASSADFWQTDLGRLCALSFMEVTANTFRHFIDLTADLRSEIERQGGRASYVAYGYHGTEVLVGNEYRWQSYSPYLQGFAKLELENIAAESFKQGVRASVYNAPEILTNSSSIFLGVEVSLYPLLGALEKEGTKSAPCRDLVDRCLKLLKPGVSLDEIMNYTADYFRSPVIRQWSNFSAWPQHNGPEQMAKMREASTHLIEMHQDTRNMMTAILSEIVFVACGKLIFSQSWEPQHPVWWIGHDIVAKQTAQ